jgi:hypothetical protein
MVGWLLGDIGLLRNEEEMLSGLAWALLRTF